MVKAIISIFLFVSSVNNSYCQEIVPFNATITYADSVPRIDRHLPPGMKLIIINLCDNGKKQKNVSILYENYQVDTLKCKLRARLEQEIVRDTWIYYAGNERDLFLSKLNIQLTDECIFINEMNSYYFTKDQVRVEVIVSSDGIMVHGTYTGKKQKNGANKLVFI
jgi:hypothetical protein